MKLFTTILLISRLSSSCTNHQQPNTNLLPASESDPSTKLFRIVQNQQFGYMDQKGRVIIKPQFDDAEDFSEGLALVVAKAKNSSST